jgi:HEAT repeat protein
MQLLLLIASFATAHADEAMRGRVLDLLSGIEEPATAADWSALGAAAAPELLAITKDPAALPTQRGNALVALGHFPSAETKSMLSGVVRDTGADTLLRRKACTGLALAFGDEALADLGVALADADVQLRSSAARAIGSVGTPAAKAALEARLGTESNASVRTAISQSLAAKE